MYSYNQLKKTIINNNNNNININSYIWIKKPNDLLKNKLKKKRN